MSAYPDYVTTEEAAKILKVTAATVRAWVRSGRLKAVSFGRLRRIPAAALREGVKPKEAAQ